MKIRLSDKARAARQRALELMVLHGLEGWSFAFSRKVRRLGECYFDIKTISLSIHHVEYHDEAAVEDTILHEIAHALCGPSSVHHDEVWRATAIRVGANPDWRGSCKTPPGRWQAVCPSCGLVYHRYKNPAKSSVVARGKIWYCRKCGVEQGRLLWREVGVCSPRGDAAGVAEEPNGTQGLEKVPRQTSHWPFSGTME
jgi:predicted SprT family Zn-dependent metalloprotease